MDQPGPAASLPIVRVERWLPAAPDRVFEAWLDPGSMARWLSPTGHAVVASDPRPGGRFRIVMIGEDTQIEHVGRYLELEPGRRLRFTWSSPYTGGDSLVTVELEADSDGTRLTLVHERLPEEHREPHAGGWGRMLDLLAAELAQGSTSTVPRLGQAGRNGAST